MNRPTFMIDGNYWNVRTVSDAQEAIEYGQSLAAQALEYATACGSELCLVQAMEDMPSEPDAVSQSFICELMTSDDSKIRENVAFMYWYTKHYRQQLEAEAV